jgi:hypothetical protein
MAIGALSSLDNSGFFNHRSEPAVVSTERFFAFFLSIGSSGFSPAASLTLVAPATCQATSIGTKQYPLATPGPLLFPFI